MVKAQTSRLTAAVLWLSAAAGVMGVASGPAVAHGGETLTDATAVSAWEPTPDVVLPTAAIALIYAVGVVRRAAIVDPVLQWRHLMFFAGVGALFLALQSPIDPIAERLFFVHQIQHLLLRMLGPMLIALAWPQGILVAGLPASIRRGLVAPMARQRWLRRAFRTVAHPVVVTALYVGALYVWEIPRYHDAALRDEAVHYSMHLTMLLAGLIFWWRIFDRRPPPNGLRFGVRAMMLWLVILSNIVLGAYTTLKSAVLYRGYDAPGRLFGYAPLADEQVGGVVIWIPSSMMCVIAFLVILYMWGRHETKTEARRVTWSPSNSDSIRYLTTGALLIEQQRRKNRVLALGFIAFVLAVLATTLAIGVFASL